VIGSIGPSPEFADDRELDLYSTDETRDRCRDLAEVVAASMNAYLRWLDENQD
jgi:hypothetical protein